MQLRTQYSRILIIGIIIILAIAWYFFATRIPFVESTFDNGHENWLVSGDAESGLPNYSIDGGNPGGFVFAEDKAVGGVHLLQSNVAPRARNAHFIPCRR